MECPNCGNEVYERLDYAIVQCTQCMSLWDPYVYPGFPEPNVDIGEIWDTSERPDDDLIGGEIDLDEDLDEPEEGEEYDWGEVDEDADLEEELDDWDEEDEIDEEEEDDY